MTKIGTLRELGVKPGDVVMAVAWRGGKPIWDFYYSINWTIYSKHPKGYCNCVCAVYDEQGGGYTTIDEDMIFRIISRATPEPKLWRDMTAEEKGALLLAAHEGKVIEYWKRGSGGWSNKPSVWSEHESYRIKPEPKVETVTQYWKTNAKGEFVTMAKEHHNTATHAVTFNLIDGKPDCASVKMEKL